MSGFSDYIILSEKLVETENGKEIVAVLKFRNGAISVCYIPHGRTAEEEKRTWLDNFTVACFGAFRSDYNLNGQELTLILKEKE